MKANACKCNKYYIIYYYRWPEPKDSKALRIAKISRENVFKVADQLQTKGIKPTVAKVHEKLGGGSTTTVHKYLSDWKAQNVGGTRLDPAQLQAQLVEKLKIIENLTLEIFNSSSLVAHERAENAKLQARVLELEGRLEERAQAHQEVAQQYAQTEANLKASFDSMVQVLSDQIRAINAQAIQKVQEAGQHFDDKVMDLKLELRDVKEQLAQNSKGAKSLQSEILHE